MPPTDSTDGRPDPDELLARVQAAESRRQRGKLKIFLGPAAGVGKTYAMLDAARTRKAEGMDVVAGYVETHGRQETEALLSGLESLPPRVTDYRGVKLHEFDLDAALARHPTLILVDELAHANTPGSRHTKRWQDVQELLDAGINVYSTVNVQHLESLNDVVAQITGVVVRETIPDSVVESADEVELIDLAPDDLLQRLRDGKVYVPEQAERALRSFFRKGNLMALRELAMRQTAERVDTQMLDYMRDHDVPRTWPATERILVSIGPSPLSMRLVRAAHRMALGLHADWLAVYVETPEHLHLSQSARDGVACTLRAAEQLGAETATLSGRSAAEELLEFARSRNVSKIIVGKPARPRWREILLGSVVDELVRRSGDIDVYVITGDRDGAQPRPGRQPVGAVRWAGYGWAALVIGACTALALLMLPLFEVTNLVMVYLLGVVITAAWQGLGPSILASTLGVLAFDFFLVPPRFTFAVADTQYLLTFGVMLVVAILISTLTATVRQQAAAARERERRTAALYALSRDLASTSSNARLAQIATRHISDVLESQVTLLLPDASGRLAPVGVDQGVPALEANELAVAEWVHVHSRMAGMATQTLPSSGALYLPLVGSHGAVGVLGVRPAQALRVIPPQQLRLLEALANQTALALERAVLLEESEKAKVQIETERMRNALLSSVSHDLRTPLAAIAGASSSLLEDAEIRRVDAWRELAQTILDEAGLLNRLIQNVLDMTRLEAGAVQIHKEWHSLEEIVGATLARLDDRLTEHPVHTHLPPDLPLVPLDSVLIQQVLVNLVENAIVYTPAGGPIDISAWMGAASVTVEVADRGPGIPPGDEERVFEKFYRLRQGHSGAGVGLGLTICRGIVQVHGGKIWVESRAGGGAAFRFTLPVEGSSPQLSPEET